MEPAPLAHQTEAASLWQRAPAWRNLVVAATFLTAAALALPQLAPEPETPPQAPARLAAVTPVAATPPAAMPVAPPIVAPVQREVVASVPSQAPVPQPAAPQVQAQPAMPQVQAQPVPAENAQACSISLPYQARAMGTGVVIGFERPARAQARMLNNQRQVGGPINPAYAMTPRMIVRMDRGGQDQIVVLPQGQAAQIGDRVSFNGIHRDPGSVCAFVPPLLAGNAGPAAEGAAGPAMGQSSGAITP
jgi:hypothetical protein